MIGINMQNYEKTSCLFVGGTYHGSRLNVMDEVDEIIIESVGMVTETYRRDTNFPFNFEIQGHKIHEDF
jgi:hypothetical protein